MPGDGHIGGDLEREPGNGSDDGEDSPDDDVFDGMDVPRQGEEDIVFDPGDGDEEDGSISLGMEWCEIIETEGDDQKKKRRRRSRRRKEKKPDCDPEGARDEGRGMVPARR